jgi:hypothetical protein
MLDHDTWVHSLISTYLENSSWPEKGSLVSTLETMLLGKTKFERLQAEEGCSIHHGPI